MSKSDRRACNGVLKQALTGSDIHVKAQPIDNTSYFQELINKFGSKAEKAIKGVL